MRWRIARLYGDEPTGETDALGVPETSRADLGEAMVRPVPVADTARSPQGENPYAERELALVTPIPLRRAQRASEAVLDGVAYEVTGVGDTGRMRLLTVRRVKR